MDWIILPEPTCRDGYVIFTISTIQARHGFHERERERERERGDLMELNHKEGKCKLFWKV